jgi:hypothetical protein
MTSPIDFAKILRDSRTAPREETVVVRQDVETAKAFLLALRTCGKRPNNNGVMMTNREYVKPDEGLAIKAFVGEYSPAIPHGKQLDDARALAARIIQGIDGATAKPYSKSTPTVGGFVAGMPDNKGKAIASLEAQLREAITDAANEKPGATQRIETIRNLIYQVG